MREHSGPRKDIGLMTRSNSVVCVDLNRFELVHGGINMW